MFLSKKQQHYKGTGVRRRYILTINVTVLPLGEEAKNKLRSTRELRLDLFKHLLYTNQRRITGKQMTLLKHIKWGSNFL